ncbi:uncharacterized protein LOC130998623 [Salvia miltiorrhiza]|uniref:uncharacterized protein LOC130998623 n=1 Tax=Salvia miltiorrhiza TaxID=226208 RepID=UPI0025AC2912|nr:uncharacterized protein LOC130998623 [Salvia miltiorrhiza]
MPGPYGLKYMSQADGLHLFFRRASHLFVKLPCGKEFGGSSKDHGYATRPKERTANEAEILQIPGDLWNEGDKSEQASHDLVGRLICPKPSNGFHLLEIMKKSWKTKGEFIAREWKKNLYLFSFANQEDREWVIQHQPWHFDGYLFAIAPLDGAIQPSYIQITKCNLWVRVYDLSMRCLNPVILRNIVAQVGNVVEVDTKANFSGCFARFRVELDITTPLMHDITIYFGGKNLWIPLKYENLPTFCYKCGVMGHHTRACEKELEDDDSGKQFEDLLCGPNLKASPLKRIRPPVINSSLPHNNQPKSTYPHPNSKENWPNLPHSRRPRPPSLSFNLPVGKPC